MLLEGVVIVGSILLAFTIQAGWDEAQERSEERATIQRLQAEFRANAVQAAQKRVALDSVRVALESVMDLTLAGPSNEVPADSIGRLAEAVTRLHTYDPRNGALSSLLTSGQLSIIRDVALRDALAAWPSAVADLREIENIVLRLNQDRLMPYLSGRISIRALNVFFEVQSGPGQAGIFPDDFLQLLADREFENLVQEKLWWADIALVRYVAVEAKLEDILATLTAAQDG